MNKMKTALSARLPIIRQIILTVVLGIVALISSLYVNAQNGVRSSDIKVLGTSNLHDWKMKAQSTSLSAKFDLKPGTNQLTELSALSFTMPVKGLKSDESLMDSRAYSTLKADKYEKIAFNMSSAVVTPGANNQYVVKATGNLTISGVTKPVTLVANGVVNPDKTITITGAQKIKMSEFGVKPPTFMLGALKVGDVVTVEYNLKFNG
jgi:polyisoprenoid-binding protein YceI